MNNLLNKTIIKSSAILLLGSGLFFGGCSSTSSTSTDNSTTTTSSTTLSLSAAVTTLAGTAGSSGSADGTGTAATFNQPYDGTVDNGNLYVTDFGNHLIRKIVISSGVVTTLAGTGSSGSADGTGTAASFYSPGGITSDGTNLFVAGINNHIIRKIVISSGVVTTFAGTGSTGSSDGTGTAASFNFPFGITNDGTNLFVVDAQNHLIRKIVISSGVVTTFAGTGSRGSADGTGTAASFNAPGGITSDGTNLFVADVGNHLIRKIVISSGVVTTIAGTGSTGSSDGTGTAASFNLPFGITNDGTNLFVVDAQNHLIRKIVISSGVVTTFAGTGSFGSADGTGTAASFNAPGITNDGTNLFVADRRNNTIRKVVISTGVVTTFAGTGSAGSADGTGTAASFNYPQSITHDGTSLFVMDLSNHTIRKID